MSDYYNHSCIFLTGLMKINIHLKNQQLMMYHLKKILGHGFIDVLSCNTLNVATERHSGMINETLHCYSLKDHLAIQPSLSCIQLYSCIQRQFQVRRVCTEFNLFVN